MKQLKNLKFQLLEKILILLLKVVMNMQLYFL